MALVNSLSTALLNSPFKCRCLPVAATILSQPAGFVVDPTVKQLKEAGAAYRARLVFNVDTEELISSSLQMLNHGSVSLDETEELISLGLSAAK